MIHFDFNERYQDEAVVGSAISRREGVLMSVVFHGALLALLIFAPQWPVFQPSPEDVAQAEEQRLLAEQRERENRTFVFVKPRVDLEAEKPPARAELADKDRVARAPQVAPNPTNPMPFSRGDSNERVEESQQARAGTPDPVAPPAPEPTPAPPAAEEKPRLLPPSDTGYARPQETPRRIRICRRRSRPFRRPPSSAACSRPRASPASRPSL